MDQRFSILERSLKIQIDSLLEFIQTQQKFLQEQGRGLGVETTKVQPILPSPSLAEMQVKVEEVQARLQAVQRLETQGQILFSTIQGLSQ